MAQQLDIPDDMLAPGDLVDAYYQIRPGTSQYLVDAAIGDIKQALASDRRFHYQGSRIETLLEEDDGQVYEYLIVTLQIADPSKVTGSHPGDLPVQEAGFFVPILVAVTMLAGALAAAYYSYAITYVSFQVTRQKELDLERTRAIIESEMSPAEKEAAFEAQAEDAKATQRTSRSIGSGIAALGAGLVTAAIIIGVLWALSLSTGRGATD